MEKRNATGVRGRSNDVRNKEVKAEEEEDQNKFEEFVAWVKARDTSTNTDGCRFDPCQRE
jgi:hypothetical protein